jgi:hypothetical protein
MLVTVFTETPARYASWCAVSPCDCRASLIRLPSLLIH